MGRGRVIASRLRSSDLILVVPTREHDLESRKHEVSTERMSRLHSPTVVAMMSCNRYLYLRNLPFLSVWRHDSRQALSNVCYHRRVMQRIAASVSYITIDCL